MMIKSYSHPQSTPWSPVHFYGRNTSLTVEFSRQDSQQLALLDNPTPQLTGRQWEDLHNVFYRKHPDRNTRFMDQREMHVHIKLDAMEESHRQLPRRNDLYRMSTPTILEGPFTSGFTPILQPQHRSLDDNRRRTSYTSDTTAAQQEPIRRGRHVYRPLRGDVAFRHVSDRFLLCRRSVAGVQRPPTVVV